MKTNHPKIFIILVNYNGEKDTLECLDSLKKITYKNYKILLVDNASKNQKEFVLKIQEYFPEIKVFAQKENTGFAGGNNIGIDYAIKNQADYILLLNNDTKVAPDFLDKLIEASQKNPKGGLFAPKIYFYDKPDVIWHASCKFSWAGGGKPMQYMKKDKNKSETKIKKTEYVSGCAMLIKKDVVQKIGKLNEEFFMYYEDTDYSLRAKKAGFELFYVPSSHIWHKVSQSTKKAMTNPKIHYYHVRNALLLSKRNAPKPILFGIYIWSFYLYLKQIVKYIFLPKRRTSAKMIMLAIQDFYKGKFGKLTL